MKKIFVSLVVLFLLTGCFSSKTKSESSYSMNRLHTGSSKTVMPAIDTLPQYQDIYHLYRSERVLLWQTDTILLVVTYDEATYVTEKAKLDVSFSYLEAYDDWLTTSTFPQMQFSVGDFDFKILCDEHGYGDYPHDFGMIAVSDKRHSIAYLYLFDPDLDTVGDSFPEFIRDYFPYEW